MSKKKAKKKTAKPAAKTTKAYKSFDDWWSKVASKQVDKIEKAWLKNNEPNDEGCLGEARQEKVRR